MEDTIILYPSPGMGHLVPMVELGKLILTHNPSFTITILITTAPFDTGSTSSYIHRVSAATPSINFHHLPAISLPSATSSLNGLALFFELPRLYNPNLHHALQTITSQNSSRPKASIIDFFCYSSFEVFTDLDIPTYYFFTSSPCSLSTILSLPSTHHTMSEKLRDPNNTSFDFPGVPPIPTPDLPRPYLDTEGIGYKSFIGTSISMAKSAGILVNTCYAFLPRAIKAISDGLCTPDSPAPPVYCVGPIIAKSSGEDQEERECLRWLDSQPSQSVVFLCFGSMGLFKAEQLMEMAIGLERCGHRFLWVVRSPPADGQAEGILADPDLDVLLPSGFLDRTRGRGLVVKKWAPQVAVLSHDSVGGFVTHCGWNSILEAVSAGVPMVGWPLYAEQRFNRVVLVEEMKVALALEESESGLVSADELEKRVSELMDPVSGKAVRERVGEMRDSAKAALADGGSSRVALVELWKDQLIPS